MNNDFPHLEIGHAPLAGKRGRDSVFVDVLQPQQSPGMGRQLTEAGIGFEKMGKAPCSLAKSGRRSALHIILVSNRLSTAKTITLTPRKLLLAAIMFLALVLSLSSLFSYLTVRHAATIRLPILQDLLRSVNAEQSQKSVEYLKTLAVKLGEMQAQLIHLDSMGERLARTAGIRVPEKPGPATAGGQGGPLVLDGALSPRELQQALNELSAQVEQRTGMLSALESQLFEERLRKHFIPTSLPIEGTWNASAFGWREDPFTGARAMHEGVDFSAETGTPIMAAAAGVVVAAERHPEYGNVVEIDHGNDLTTRYGHASKLLVSPGATVKRGQVIALVGSTGRSTGPHLHFEVRYRGNAQNPNRFLQQAQANTLARH